MPSPSPRQSRNTSITTRITATSIIVNLTIITITAVTLTNQEIHFTANNPRHTPVPLHIVVYHLCPCSLRRFDLQKLGDLQKGHECLPLSPTFVTWCSLWLKKVQKNHTRMSLCTKTTPPIQKKAQFSPCTLPLSHIGGICICRQIICVSSASFNDVLLWPMRGRSLQASFVRLRPASVDFRRWLVFRSNEVKRSATARPFDRCKGGKSMSFRDRGVKIPMKSIQSPVRTARMSHFIASLKEWEAYYSWYYIYGRTQDR